MKVHVHGGIDSMTHADITKEAGGDRETVFASRVHATHPIRRADRSGNEGKAANSQVKGRPRRDDKRQ